MSGASGDAAAGVQLHRHAAHHHASVAVGLGAFHHAIGIGRQQQAGDQGIGFRGTAAIFLAKHVQQIVPDLAGFPGGHGVDAPVPQAEVEVGAFRFVQAGQAIDGVGDFHGFRRSGVAPAGAHPHIPFPHQRGQGRPQGGFPGGGGIRQQPAQPGMHRQFRQAFTQSSQRPVAVHRGREHGQEVLGGLQALFPRGFEPRETPGVRVVPGLQGQDRPRQIHALDFGFRGGGALGIDQGRGQAHAASWRRAPGPACPLGQAGATDWLQAQFIEAGGGIVAVHPGGAGVDHRADPRDRHRGFRDIRGQHDFRSGSRGQRPILLVRGQAAVEGQDLPVQTQGLHRPLALADFPGARQEHQDVPGVLPGGFFGHGVGHLFFQAAVRHQGAVAGGHREGPARGVDHRAVP